MAENVLTQAAQALGRGRNALAGALRSADQWADESIRYYGGPQVHDTAVRALNFLNALSPMQDYAQAIQGSQQAVQGENALTRASGAVDMLSGLGSAMMPGNASDLAPLMGMAFPAWHGSPHKFDKFSLDAIGTGEGNQAYGHGLYFAESPDVAKVYAGHQGRASSDAMPNVAQKVIASGQDPDEMLRLVFPSATDDDVARAIEAAKSPPTGHLYRTTIDAEPEDLLDWDAPLSEQPLKVRQLLDEPEISGPLSELADAFGMTFDPTAQTGGDLYRLIGLGLERDMLPVNGPGVEQALEAGNRAAAAAAWLRNESAYGIRYLDGGSRGKGDGTRNFVIFDDELVRIDEIDGVPR